MEIQAELAKARLHWVQGHAKHLAARGHAGGEAAIQVPDSPLSEPPPLPEPVDAVTVAAAPPDSPPSPLSEPAPTPADDPAVQCLPCAPRAPYVVCGCGVGGVHASSREHAMPFRSARSNGQAFHASTHLDMLLLPSGPLGVGMPPELDAALREDVLKLNPDDDIVLKDGCGPAYVHLNETDYKSTRRTRMGESRVCERRGRERRPGDETLDSRVGLCYGDQTLASYGMEYSQDGAHSENVSMRHFTPLYYAVMDYVWRAWRPYLDPEFASERPDRLDVLPFRDGQFMDYHTDSRPRPGAPPDAPVAQRRGSPVLTLNLFQDMNFWCGERALHFAAHGLIYPFRPSQVPASLPSRALSWPPCSGMSGNPPTADLSMSGNRPSVLVSNSVTMSSSSLA